MLEPKVILLGDNDAQKTSFKIKATEINFFKPVKNLTSTLEMGLAKIPFLIDETIVNLHIWDTGGMEKYGALHPIFFKNATVAILIFSLINESTLALIPKYFDLIKQNCKEMPILFLVGNRNDLVDERVISSERGQEAADQMNAFYYEVSSKTGAGIEDLIKQIATQSLNFGKFKLYINSIKCNYDFRKLKYPFS